MREEYIESMIRRLKPVLKDAEKAGAILKRYWRTRMALVWTVEDVYRAANECDVALTQAEALAVLRTLHEQHNAQYGLKWEDLTAHIKDNVLGRALTKPEMRRLVDTHRVIIQK